MDDKEYTEKLREAYLVRMARGVAEYGIGSRRLRYDSPKDLLDAIDRTDPAKAPKFRRVVVRD